MARTQRLRRVGIILFATLVAVSIFLGNQRPAHASLATDIICLVYSELNIFGSPIPHLTADGCDAAPPTAGSGTLKVVKIVAGGSAFPSDFSLHVKSGGTDVGGSPQPGSVAGTSYIGLAPGDYVVSETGPDNYNANFVGACDSSGVVTVTDSLIPVVCTITNTYSALPPPLDGEDTLLRCSDTVDNDGDGDIDLEDPDCASFIPTLTIVKNTTGGNATFHFTVSGATSVTTSFATAGGSGTSAALALGVGTSTVLEDAASDWTLSGVACLEGSSNVGIPVLRGKELNLAIGDDVTCTFSNTFTGGGGGGGGSGADISLTKSVDNATPNLGATVTYTLTVSVTGDDATGVVVHDALSAGLTFVSTSSIDTIGVYSSTTGNWTIGTLASTTPATLHIMATVNSDLAGGAIVSNTASVSAGDTSSAHGNDTSSASFTVTIPSTTGGAQTEDTGGGGGGGGGGNSSGGCASGFLWNPTTRKCDPKGQVLGATTPTVATSTPAMCSTPLLSSYMRRGMKNDPVQVKKLQQFLNSDPATRLAITGPGSPGNETGFFGPLTEAAVNKFQVKYAEDVLEPWNRFGLLNHTPTGYVYKTTLHKINLVYCANLKVPLPMLP